jgi:uncharacterized pyridoxal phosphate-containing UPF0001 family protein
LRIHIKIVILQSPQLPKLVAVSKKQNDDKVIEALEAGQKYFGENRVQEAQERWSLKTQQYKNLEIRLIGPLQTNKVKQALNLFDVIETIDREKLAKEIAKSLMKMLKLKAFIYKLILEVKFKRVVLNPSIR